MTANEIVWHVAHKDGPAPAPTSNRDLLLVNLSSYGGEPRFVVLAAIGTSGWLRCDTLEAPDNEFWEDAYAYMAIRAIRWTNP